MFNREAVSFNCLLFPHLSVVLCTVLVKMVQHYIFIAAQRRYVENADKSKQATCYFFFFHLYLYNTNESTAYWFCKSIKPCSGVFRLPLLLRSLLLLWGFFWRKQSQHALVLLGYMHWSLNTYISIQ